ncbi:MAG: hypothetical protein JXR50_07485 [Prolixibacteraceae bacterium]|nr:hypothetical protein [Prolixibacteraceae bacterium]MBN2649566.1 hypothetical protein [Prolixibacteraceae bacterium]
MKTHTLFIVSLAVMLAVFAVSLVNKPAKAEIISVIIVEPETEMMIEDWMLDEKFWGFEEKAIVVKEEPEGSLEIESWMYDDEYWGLN